MWRRLASRLIFTKITQQLLDVHCHDTQHLPIADGHISISHSSNSHSNLQSTHSFSVWWALDHDTNLHPSSTQWLQLIAYRHLCTSHDMQYWQRWTVIDYSRIYRSNMQTEKTNNKTYTNRLTASCYNNTFYQSVDAESFQWLTKY